MKEFIIKATNKVDKKIGKKKIVELHFPDNIIRKLTDRNFIRIGKPKIEWCIDAIEFDQDNGSYDDCFIIELGSVLS